MRMLLLSLALTALADEAKAPDLPAENKAAILQIELRMSQSQNEYTQLQERMKVILESFQKDSASLQTAQAEACKAAKVDCEKDWTLDLQALKFVAKPKPVPEKKP